MNRVLDSTIGGRLWPRSQAQSRVRFHFSAAVGLVYFLTCVTRSDRRVNFCMGKDSYSSQTTKEDSESILLAATLRSLFVPQTER